MQEANFYKINEIDNMQFLIIPKTLFTSENYRDLLDGAKLLYAVLLERMQLSKKNGWADENGNVYIIYPREEIANFMKISIKTVVRYMKALKEYGLILEKRQGLSRPNIIYVLKPYSRDEEFFTSRVDSDVHSRMDNMTKTEWTNLPPNHTNMNHTEINKKNNTNTLVDKFHAITGRRNWKLFVILLKKYSYDYILEKLNYMEMFAKSHLIRNFEGFLASALRDNYMTVAQKIEKTSRKVLLETYQKLEYYRSVKPASKEVALAWITLIKNQLTGGMEVCPC
ncbi:replication initiator protein A [Thermosediminibacter oceani]|uniref:Replication initiator A domain protein n=1 Tax=Thermosediminibacter oceani (strain ATCC BAA-1034 / DSM 16646 / JW/IW-1228P) TaxID=555079 RepID=D9S2W8_THEOJ|nr:replication initiator protein A [Thermosediminibacter oceani]ADL07745.1 replication initiator A domain protein [Thermosediminibacter oceani DSM 16646]